jgi:hypothetical protein
VPAPESLHPAQLPAVAVVTHYIERCQHGHTHGQCRCPDRNKPVRIVACPWPDDYLPRHRKDPGP